MKKYIDILDMMSLMEVITNNIRGRKLKGKIGILKTFTI